ncbi:MAG: hypothetical protein IE928_01305 [Gammaproteobacteria bacterium]|nr:hypothetical protein [Gammaproteobacteria bacterium]
MTKTLTLTTLLSLALLTGCATTGDTAQGTGYAAFYEAAKVAMEKNAKAMKAGYAWTSKGVKTKYDPKTEAGKAFKKSGRKLTLVDVALFEGEQALKKGDEKTAMKKVKEANELADAQLSQMAISSDYKILWK